MSRINPPKKAKLVIGFFLNDKKISSSVIKDLGGTFGSIDMVSPWIIFNHTVYYRKEMSYPLYRKILTFKHLIDQFNLDKIKLTTDSLEKKYVSSGRRLVNIDPGYILAERFVLATGKNYAHRICIGAGVYADLTLVYSGRKFQKLPWTYPDYAEAHLEKFLTLTRNKYLVDLKKIENNTT